MNGARGLPRPLLFGILNVTPDSFSGDGLLHGDALAAADALVADGADVLDIGAESTRPQAQALDAAAEWQRLAPVLAGLATRPWRARVRLSVDTRHAPTAERALAAGVEIVNCVAGIADPAMQTVLAAARGDVIVMHALSVPVDPALLLPPDVDVLQVILDWKHEVIARARAAGIDPDRLVFDPGIGFGKRAHQSLALVHGAGRLVASGGRWLFGHSRKSFLGLFTTAPAAGRDDLTLAFSAGLAQAGVQMLRVHAVARHAALFGG